MKTVTMTASVAFNHKGVSLRPGQDFQATALDAVILQHKRKAKIAKTRSSKPIATTPASVVVPPAGIEQQQQTVETSGPVQTSQMEPVSESAELTTTDETTTAENQPTTAETASRPTGRGRYRRTDLRPDAK